MELGKISFLNRIKGGNEAQTVYSAQAHTSINFANIGGEKKSMSMLVPVILVTVLCTVVFAKFAVYDRFSRLWAEEEKAASMQTELLERTARVNEAAELSERYYHYTWSGMSADEKDLVTRESVMELLSFLSKNVLSVESCTLSDERMTVPITAKSLESVSRLVEKLEAQELVSTVTVTTAQTGMEIEMAEQQNVRAQLTIYIKSLSEVQGTAGAEGTAAEE